MQGLEYDDDTYQLKFRIADLHPNTTYTVKLKKEVQDFSDNKMANDFTWSFVTQVVLPPQITNLRKSQPNFRADMSELTFYAALSTNVKQVDLILTDMDTTREYRLTDMSGTQVNSTVPVNYSMSWNGLVNNDRIPDGEYSYAMEAMDRRFGLIGSSEYQPFMWKVRGTGAVEVKATHSFARPNFAQTVEVNITDGNMRLQIPGGGTQQFVGQRFYSLNANQGIFFEKEFCSDVWGPFNKIFKDCNWNPFGAIPMGNITFWMRYADTSDEFFADSNISAGYARVGRVSKLVIPFQINFTAPSGYPGFQVSIFTLDVLRPTETKFRNLRLAGHTFGDAYDDNPEVKTDVFVDEIGTNWIKGELTAVNTSRKDPPFLIDRSAPMVRVNAAPAMISPVLGRKSAIQFQILDNLKYDLSDVALFIQKQSSVTMVRNLVSEPKSSQIARNLVWDGSDDKEKNVSDGIYVIIGRAKDLAGNQGEARQNIIVDSTPPEVSGAKLEAVPGLSKLGAVALSGKDDRVRVSMNVRDNFSSKVYVKLKLTPFFSPLERGNEKGFDAGIVRYATFTVTSDMSAHDFTFDWKDEQGNYLPDGLYKVSAEVTDEAGNARSMTLPDFKADRTPPKIMFQYTDKMLFLTASSSVTVYVGFNENVHIKLAIADALGQVVRGDEMYRSTQIVHVNHVNIGDIAISAFYWDGKDEEGVYPADGAYTIRHYAQDTLGNETISTLGVIKNGLPARITYPALSTTTARVSGTVSIRGIATDPIINDTTDFWRYELWVTTAQKVECGKWKVWKTAFQFPRRIRARAMLITPTPTYPTAA